MSGVNSHKVDRNALKQYRIAVEDEGFDFGQSYNLYKKVGVSKVRSALPTTQIMKSDMFKYVGDIEEDYNETGRMGDAIRNPSAPPDEFSQMMNLVPEDLYKSGVMESKDDLAQQYVRTALQKFSNGRLKNPHAKGGGGPGGGSDDLDHDPLTGNGLIPPQVVVDIPDKQSHDMAGIFQAAIKNWRGSTSFMNNPQFTKRAIDKAETIVLEKGSLTTEKFEGLRDIFNDTRRTNMDQTGRSGTKNPHRR